MALTAALVCVLAVQGALAGARAGALGRGPEDDRGEDWYDLPKGLLVGAGLSAAQAEGAWNEGGKSESIIDFLGHSPHSTMYAKGNVDVAADHYHRYKDDLKFGKDMNFTTHRFSISWSRVLPDGDPAHPNGEGVQFYHDYIKEVKANGMEPMVTMYHFDHPIKVENETGGWSKPAMVDKFVDYAKFLMQEYGKEVKYWNPINEGNMYCIYILPALTKVGVNPVDDNSYWTCLHHTVVAHAKVYRLFKNSPSQVNKDVEIGTSVLLWPGTAASSSYEDTLAAVTFNEVFAGSGIHPLVYGDYPHSTRYLVDKRSKELGILSPLPDEKEQFVDGPLTDFVAINVYAGFKVEYETNSSNLGARPWLLRPAIDVLTFVKFSSGFGEQDDQLLKNTLLWAWNSYHMPIIITENGMGDLKHMGVRDTERAIYFSVNMRMLVRTMKEYDIPVISYHAWSLIDVYEYSGGYKNLLYGLVHVDFAGNTLNRTEKDSSNFFKLMAKTGHVPLVSSSSTLSIGPILLLSALFSLCTLAATA